jgi:hypothetical protein
VLLLIMHEGMSGHNMGLHILVVLIWWFAAHQEAFSMSTFQQFNCSSQQLPRQWPCHSCACPVSKQPTS